MYGGAGRAARNWKEYQTIVKTLKELEADETMLVQSGKAVGVLKTWSHAPRVLIANSNLVPAWSTQEYFDEARPHGPDDVRPDDGRLVDLHRHPGHFAGHL
ncbi:hypothetical protein ACFQT0_19030 [Hymenobacter humi]|uniref:Urocanase N-terminal domain-containing protein n=1 Tax=Hymenobacter humi TaxID=1411620 RepID=A0ABW2UA88_9BACT